jgi:hypothetical protein
MNSTMKVNLDLAEIGSLWTTYIGNSASICFLRYFLEKVDDSETRSEIEFSLNIYQEHDKTIKKFFNSENYPIPQGFNDEDVNIKAPRLYSDEFFLFYIRNLSRITLITSGFALGALKRADIRDFFSKVIVDAIEVYNRVVTVLLNKDLLAEPPTSPISNRVDFITSQDFLAGWFSERRKLLALEVSQLFLTIWTNTTGEWLLTGFSQVAQSGVVREYIQRGAEIASKHVKLFESKLKDEGLTVKTPGNITPVLNSTTAPFSEKLMLFEVLTGNATGIANYGAALSTSMRHDIQADYVRLTAEIAAYAHSGVKIMIDNGWIEQPPQAISSEV